MGCAASKQGVYAPEHVTKQLVRSDTFNGAHASKIKMMTAPRLMDAAHNAIVHEESGKSDPAEQQTTSETVLGETVLEVTGPLACPTSPDHSIIVGLSGRFGRMDSHGNLIELGGEQSSHKISWRDDMGSGESIEDIHEVSTDEGGNACSIM